MWKFIIFVIYREILVLALSVLTALVIDIVSANWEEFYESMILLFFLYQLVVLVQILDFYGKKKSILNKKRGAKQIRENEVKR